MKTAIIGLPRVGKTSLFTILTGVHEAARMGSLAVRAGVARVPDRRLDAVAGLYPDAKVTHATVEYLDCPAVSKDTLRDPAYVASLRLAEAFAHVLRAFEDDRVPHEMGSVDPRRDLEHVETELILNDLMMAEKRLERLEKDRHKVKNQELDREFEVLGRVKEQLEACVPLRQLDLGGEDEKRVRGFQFLSQKPMLYVLNLGEEDGARLHDLEAEFREQALAGRAHTAVTAICGKIEAELAELAPEEVPEFLASYGLKESGLERLVFATYSVLGVISFFTASEPEVRAWALPAGSTALKAAGTVHTDFEKKFIRAEVAPWDVLVREGGYARAREKGLLRLEGKDHVVQDGDVVLIRHG
ncbi:MAG: redox-regulated ATPase YchF [Planctomycetes bacterium]|nr:redox-regulated ATPase YchF [Planctomycetota bacterium]